MADASTQKQLDWKFIQSFGDDNSSDDDLVTAVEFDETGEYLAVGDKAGRICIFESCPNGKKSQPEYKFYTEFQSHEPEFDCLKSLEIEEKINMIKWGKRRSDGIFLLATNDKTVRFWKVHEKKMMRTEKSRQEQQKSAIRGGIVIPQHTHFQTITTATPKRVFANAHGYHINSISMNSDGETFISTDDLRINLWNINNHSESFNIVDIKPANLEELTEVITTATFHPSHCNIFVYGTSRGSLRLGDMRDSALCDHHTKLFETEENPTNKSFFSEIVSSLSSVKFINGGSQLLSRDYLSLKIWDVKMENKPLAVIPIHDYLRLHLCDLYENDCIFDRFECSASSDGSQLVTGSYNNNFTIHNMATNSSMVIEAGKNPSKSAKPQKSGFGAKKKSLPESPNVNLMDFSKRALHVAWHPSLSTISVAGLNKLYIYSGSPVNNR